MGIWRFAKFSKNARTLACGGNRLSSPKVRHCHDRAWSPPRADDPDRPRPLHDDRLAFGISAPHPVAARLVVGPDDVRDVGVGNERYDTVAPSGNGVGSEVDGGHSKSSLGPRFRLRETVAGPPQRCRSFVLTARLYSHPDARLKRAAEGHIVWWDDPAAPSVWRQGAGSVAGGCGFASRPPDRTPGRHFTRAFYINGRSGEVPKLILNDTYGKSKSSV